MADSTRRLAAARSLGDGRYGIWCHYDDRLEARALIGARWDQKIKCWYVPAMFKADADALVARLNARFDTNAGTGSSVVPLTDALRVLFRTLPEDFRRPTHRALAKVMHPDQGGTHDLARALNDAWTPK